MENQPARLPLNRPTPWLVLVAFIAINLAIGAIGGLATSSSVDTWYQLLTQPAFTPPDWVFGPVWTALYIMIAVAAWLVWRAAGSLSAAAQPLTWYAVQLMFNLAWSFLFFYFRSPLAGLIDIALLWLAIVATIWHFRKWSTAAALLMIPYLLWVTYAAALNAEFVRLN